MFPDYEYSDLKTKDEIAKVLQKKLRTISYFPTYITSDLEDRIRDLQKEELEARKTKRLTINRGVEMLLEIDNIRDELAKLEKEYRLEQLKKSAQLPIEEIAARKRKLIKAKPKRKVIKKIKRKK